MTTITQDKMTDLFDHPVFNTTGWATVISFFGLNVANVNLWLTLVIGVLSICYLMVGGYLRILQAIKARREMKETENKNK